MESSLGTLTAREAEALANRLWNARTHGKPCEPLTQLRPALTVGDAYLISKENYWRRLRSAGARAVGRKIGLTSRAVQQQLGVDQPDFGYLTSDMQVPDGGTLKAGSLIHGRVEGEVAFVLGTELRGKPSFEDVVKATQHVAVCIEIIDSRVRDWKIAIQDTVADNASSAFFVLGSHPRKLADVDLRMAGMSLWKNGQLESTGVGAACLDHPVNAVAWLARTMTELGDPLQKGDVILSGAYGPIVPFAEGDRCEVRINGLGSVSASYGRGE
jgi:2-keto-4-pentenoate hydratase